MATLKQKKANPHSKYWKGKADDEWARQIRAVGKCEKCPNISGLNAHHIIARTRLRFRHDLSNGICLCAYCHNFDNSISPHVDSFAGEEFLVWLEENRSSQFQWYEENKHDKRMPEITYRQAYELLKGE